MSRHTPGPWRYKPHSIDSNYMLIFCCSSEDEGDNLRGYCGEPNARLIAAAPELLEALKAAIALYGKFGGIVNDPHAPGEWISQARAAIAKAEGGSHE